MDRDELSPGAPGSNPEASSGGRFAPYGGGRAAGGVLSYVFWCGFFGKVLADGATGGILNRTAEVGSG